jgi:hypothetical protein
LERLSSIFFLLAIKRGTNKLTHNPAITKAATVIFQGSKLSPKNNVEPNMAKMGISTAKGTTVLTG